MIDVAELGLPGLLESGHQKDLKNKTNSLWSFMKLKNAVETNREGIDRLFELYTDIINGGRDTADVVIVVVDNDDVYNKDEDNDDAEDN